MDKERRNMLSAVLFWAWSEGMKADSNEVSSNVLTAEKNGRKISFITEFDRTRQELLETIEKSEGDYIYVLTNDNGKRTELIKTIPDYCGILYYGNPFGLGALHIVLTEPKIIKK